MFLDFLFKSDELEKMREEHEKKLEKIKLKNELKIEENKLKRVLELTELNSENEQTEVKKKIFTLKNEITKDDITIENGKKLKFFAIAVTGISTLLTVSGGYNNFNKSGLILFSFIVSIIILQFSVFIIGTTETRIKEEFNRHFSKVIFLKYCLLTISIYNNYKFFEVVTTTFISKFMVLILCISLDLIAVFMVSLSFDQITLTFSYKVKRINLIYKLFTILTYNMYRKINNKFTEIEKSNIIEIEDYKNYGRIENTNLNQNDIITQDKLIEYDIDKELVKKYVNYIYDNKTHNNVVKGYKSVAIATKIDRQIAEKIRDLLNNCKITEVNGKKTKLLKDKEDIVNLLRLQTC